MNGKRSRASNGQATNAAVQADPEAPLCKIHQIPMVLQQGRFGRFWSCRQKNGRGRWCSLTQAA